MHGDEVTESTQSRPNRLGAADLVRDSLRCASLSGKVGPTLIARALHRGLDFGLQMSDLVLLHLVLPRLHLRFQDLVEYCQC